jgi:hypothetical protein
VIAAIGLRQVQALLRKTTDGTIDDLWTAMGRLRNLFAPVK